MSTKTGMGVGAKIAIGAVVMMLVLAIGVAAVAAMSYIKWNDFGVATEKQLTASYNTSEMVLGQTSNKIVEIASVTEMARDDIIATTKAAIEGRYGADGSRAVFQAISEQNPSIDPALYTKVQQVIEAGRNEFVVTQKVFIDRKAVYETSLGTVWSGFWLKLAGFPKIDLDKMRFISTDSAAQTFETGKNATIQLRQPATNK